MLRLASIALFALATTVANASADCRMPEKVEFRHPNGGEIVATFGNRLHPLLGKIHHHDGVGYVNPIGNAIVAASSGVVLHAAYSGQSGNQVAIQHRSGPDALETRYSHLTAHYLVKEGDCIEAGQVIGKLGNTGLSTGPHLHFEILVGG